MTWPPRRRRVALSDKFYADPRVQEVGNAAVGLYVLCLFSLDGHWLSDRPVYSIAAHQVEELCTLRDSRRLTRKLEDAGLFRVCRRGRRITGWELVPNDLWRISAWREPIPAALRAAVVERDKGVCQLCGQAVTREQKLHIDHILPVRHGGRSVFDNLQVAHSHCNLSKGARL